MRVYLSIVLLAPFKSKRVALGIIAAVFAASALLASFPTGTASAAEPLDETECSAKGGTWKNLAPTGGIPEMGCTGYTEYGGLTPGEQAKWWWYYHALSQCMSSVGSWNVSGDGTDLKDGKWFYSGFVIGSNGDGPAGFAMRDELSDIGDDGIINCAANDNELLRSALSLWQISGTKLACGTLFERKNGTACVEGNGSFTWKKSGMSGDEKKAAFQSFIQSANHLFGGKAPTLSDAAKYVYYRDTLLKGCAYGAQPLASDPGGKRVYEVGVVDVEGKIGTEFYIGDQDEGADRWYRTNPNQEKTCKELAELVGPDAALTKAYALWVADHPDQYEEPAVSASCTEEDAECKSSCNVPQLGWVLCPVLTVGASIADETYKFIEQLLAVKPALINADPDAGTTGTLIAWRAMQAVANVAFIIIFLVMIFSQLTSSGISNYGVKKLLPRLIIGAILVNVSFYLCQIAVDVSNIVGGSLKGLLENIANGLPKDAAAAATDESGHLGGIVVAVIAAAGVVSWVGLGALGLAVLGGLIALLTVFVILVVRQALVVLLVVLAPIAFVANLLPNTEQWFKRWWKMFLAMLMLYPLVGLLFGACILASAVLLSAAGTEVVLQIVAYIVLVVPLFAIVPMLKGSLDAAGNIGTLINRGGTRVKAGAQGSTKQAAAKYRNSGFGQFRTRKKAERKARISAGTYAGAGGALNPYNARSKANAAMNQSGVFNAVTGGYGAQRDLAAQAQNRSDQKEALDMFGGDDSLAQVWASSGGDSKHSSFATLNGVQQGQFKKMVDAGHHRKASSFLASAQYLSEGGKGSAADVSQALARAQSVGADQTTVAGAQQAAIAAYRKSGRGDALADLSTAAGSPMTQEQGWSQVTPGAVHREGIDPMKNPTGRASYEAHLQSDAEHTRQALTGFDTMEQRARVQAESAIVASAQLHQYNATGAAPTITGIQDAKDYFKVR